MPEVSVVIPCYNQGRFLAHSVQSVLAQTFNDWELIIVNDGSTDNSREVALQFADRRIHYTYQENMGLSAARNTGIQVARGEYLAFLDADDEWEPEFLMRCVSVFRKHLSAGFIYTLTSFIDPQGTSLPQLGGQTLPTEQFRNRILEGGFFPPHTVLLRRKVLEDVGDFDTSLTSVEDWDLWLRISQCYQVHGIGEPLARYRVYPGSMATNAARMHDNRVAVLTKYFGPPEGDSLAWPVDKRRGYAFAYRTSALGFIAQSEADEGWYYLLQAVEIEPGLLERLDTFYELVLGEQPRGYRGEAKQVHIAANGAELLRRMETLFALASLPVQTLKGAAYGNAYLALAMLSDQAGDWAAARGYLRRAIRLHPSFLRDPSVTRRLLKLSLGQRVVGNMRHLHSNTAGAIRE